MVLLLAGCDVTSLVVDVRRTDDSITIVAEEPDRPCRCSFGFTPPGSCRSGSDILECDCEPWPADCLDRVTIFEGGDVLDSTGWREGSTSGASLVAERTGDIELAISGCGGEARIPIPQEPRPRPAIQSSDVDGEPDQRIVTWTSDLPAASQLISLTDGYVGVTCHESGGSGARQVTVESEQVYFHVTALAPVVEHDTELGPIRVWSGNSDVLMFW